MKKRCDVNRRDDIPFKIYGGVDQLPLVPCVSGMVMNPNSRDY